MLHKGEMATLGFFNVCHAIAVPYYAMPVLTFAEKKWFFFLRDEENKAVYMEQM